MPRLSEDTIQRAAEANDIVEVIGSYFPLKRAGTSFRALCPFHKEKTPSFHVNPQRQSFHCFGCGAGGNVFRFVMEYEHLDFVSAVRRMAQRAGIPIIEEAGTAEDDRKHDLRRRLLALHAEAAAWFQHHLLKDPAAQVARDYLKSRGLNAETAKAWQLGYAPDSWDALLDFLREKKFTPDEIAESGLAASKQEEEESRGPQRFYARFRGRVMFPICNDYGEVVAFSGRVLDPEAKTAKYVNSPETPLFTKGRVLYGLHKSKRALIDAGIAIVCEGQIDLISAFESGVENVIAPQGTAFTPEQARLLRRFVETVILCFDSDRAGQEAVTRSLPALLECGMEVRVARLPAGEDPDSLIRTKGPQAFRDTVNQAKNFFDHAIDRMVETGAIGDPSKKAAAARRLGPFVAALKDKVLQEATRDRICAQLQMTREAFTSQMVVTREQLAPEEKGDEQKYAPLAVDQGVSMLCRLAIACPEVREWLKAQKSPSPTDLGQGGDLLGKILESSQSVEEPGALVIFLTTLTPQEQLTVNELHIKTLPESPLAVAQNGWFGLASKFYSVQRSETGAQLRQPHLDRSEQTRLQARIEELSKQILDLQSRLNEV